MDRPAVPLHFVRALLADNPFRRIDQTAVCRAAGLDPGEIGALQTGLDAPAYTRLVQAIWTLSADEYMGFTSTRSKPGTFATMAQLVIHCGTLRGVLHRAWQFYSLFEQPIAFHCLLNDGGPARLALRSEAVLHDPEHFFVESLLVIWHRFCSWLTDTCIVLDTVDLAYPAPPHAQAYRRLFACPARFDQTETQLVFHPRFLELPVRQTPRTLRHFLRASPADLLAKPDTTGTWRGRIRTLLGEDLNHPNTSIERIASQMHLSPQTLRRRLRDENTSWQVIKDELRRDLALHYLNRPELSVNEIARRVGFTEPSTFHRAFKKWTGLTPGHWRESLRSTTED